LSNVIPLPVYPHKPVGADLELIKKAKANIKTDIRIQPVDAVPGSPGRVLALRERPNFICEHAFIETPDENNIQAALEWVILGGEDKRGTSVTMMLKEILGDGVKQID
jgi:hypothetical protein